MADQSEVMVLTRDGAKEMARQILVEVNNRISGRIVNRIGDQSDANHVPSAQAVYNTVSNLNNIMPLVIASGDITQATITPDSKTLYVVRTSRTATEATSYIYLEGIGFIKVASGLPSGATEVDSIQTMSVEDITTAVAAAVSETQPDI